MGGGEGLAVVNGAGELHRGSDILQDAQCRERNTPRGKGKGEEGQHRERPRENEEPVRFSPICAPRQCAILVENEQDNCGR
jgi:hypothetical protein